MYHERPNLNLGDRLPLGLHSLFRGLAKLFWMFSAFTETAQRWTGDCVVLCIELEDSFLNLSSLGNSLSTLENFRACFLTHSAQKSGIKIERRVLTYVWLLCHITLWLNTPVEEKSQDKREINLETHLLVASLSTIYTHFCVVFSILE